jgi:hypothetical protein
MSDASDESRGRAEEEGEPVEDLVLEAARLRVRRSRSACEEGGSR